jgi:N-methylhydantoinase A
LRIGLGEAKLTEAQMETAFDAFHRTHEAEYGHAFHRSPIEIVNIRLIGLAPSPKLEWPRREGIGSPGEALVKKAKAKYRVDGALQDYDTAFYRRDRLPPNSLLPGPAIILQLDATTVVPPGWTFETQPKGNLILRKESTS